VVPDPNAIDVSSLAQPLDPASLIAGMTSVDGTATYSYDATGQLTGATYSSSNPQSLIPNPSPESYSYDANGNRDMPGYVIGRGNQILSDGAYDYTYDADGNCAGGDAVAAIEIDLSYNQDGLLGSIQRSLGGDVVVTSDYTYDALGRLTGLG
jgi:YD repeat-containing protein